jgi:hypothetical protein
MAQEIQVGPVDTEVHFYVERWIVHNEI